MDDLTDTLNADQARLWQEYLSAEAIGIRPRFLSALSVFIKALQQDSQERRDAFTETFCRRVADDGQTLPLREPLFVAIIGPYLVSAFQKKRKNSERYLVHFYPHFRNMPAAQKLIAVPAPQWNYWHRHTGVIPTMFRHRMR